MPLWLRSMLTTILFPGVVAGAVPWWIARSPSAGRIPLGPARWLGLVFLVAGLVVLFQTIWDFAASGRGTLAPWDAPRLLVRGRIYKWVRNPMYLGVLSIILGQGLLRESPGVAIYGLFMAAAFHIRVVVFEEPALRDQFGDAYADYVNEVPRWIPRQPKTGPH